MRWSRICNVWISLQEEHDNTKQHFTFFFPFCYHKTKLLRVRNTHKCKKIDIYPNLFWWPEVGTVNWSFLLLWPSQRTLYISARLDAPEIRQSWSHFIAAWRSLPKKTDAGQIVCVALPKRDGDSRVYWALKVLLCLCSFCRLIEASHTGHCFHLQML